MCKAMSMPFKNLHDSVVLLRVVVAWAQDCVPRLLSECGLKTTGNLFADVAALRTTAGVAKSYLPKELDALCDTVGVKSEKRKDVVKILAPTAPSFWPSSDVLGYTP